MSGRARLAPVALPDFGAPSLHPELPVDLYRRRLARLRERMSDSGYDVVVVYADREHSANLSYLSGFDPRFEEALLVVGADGLPGLLVGNECMGMAGVAPLEMRPILYQEMSLPNQPRDRSPGLDQLLAGEGIEKGTRVGVVGWKGVVDRRHLDAPAFLVDHLRELSGDLDLVVNATDLLNDARDGLRVVNEHEQIAYFEASACHTSDAVNRLLSEMTPGMTEREAVALLGWDGSPLSCHLMLTAGERARLGLLSPGDRPIQRGDPFTVAYGVWGALNCRAGFVVEDEAALPAGIPDYLDRLVGPYFEAVVEWYQTLHVGQAGDTLQRVIDQGLGDPFFGIFLNPGHQIHLDEWVNSPVFPGSDIELASGMAMQVDIIPATGTPYFTTNIEDGIVLADTTLRGELSEAYPEMWARIEARRSFMGDQLGIDLHADVLPLSNIPACLRPLILDRERAMTVA